VRAPVLLAAGVAALTLAAGAIAERAAPPRGNFGGGALVVSPRDHFGPGNAIIGLRALPGRKLEIEATIRGSCAGGDVAAASTIAKDGTFGADGVATQEPRRGTRVKTTYRFAGTFTSRAAAEGTVSATIERTVGGRTKRCRSGAVKFGARRPDGEIGSPGAPAQARYYGTTSQRGVGPRRAIVLRVSRDGLRLSRGLFGEAVKCSDGTRAIGVEAPRAKLPIDEDGRVKDRERFTIKYPRTLVHVDDRFTAQLGSTGARGTFSLSDRTVDRTSDRTIQTCKTGAIRWIAAR
jgi:hypothetical protein